MSFRLWCVSVLAILGGAMSAGEGGGIKGTIVYDGDPPPPAVKEVKTDNAVCNCKDVPDESLVVDPKTKGIKWAIIRILEVKAPNPATNPKPPELDQKGLTFTPHVIIVAPNTDLTILNPDPVNHNVHTIPYDFLNEAKNFTQGPTTPKVTYKAAWLKQEEIIEVQCNIHPWMKGLIVCHDPRYAVVTGADGSFEIKDVPPGKYKIAIFQEKLGDATPNPLEVEIKAGTVNDLGQIKYKAKK